MSRNERRGTRADRAAFHFILSPLKSLVNGKTRYWNKKKESSSLHLLKFSLHVFESKPGEHI